jgi:hypothetical protein
MFGDVGDNVFVQLLLGRSRFPSESRSRHDFFSVLLVGNTD